MSKMASNKEISDFGEDFKKALEKILVYLRQYEIIREDNHIVTQEVEKGKINEIYACDVMNYITIHNLNDEVHDQIYDWCVEKMENRDGLIDFVNRF